MKIIKVLSLGTLLAATLSAWPQSANTPPKNVKPAAKKTANASDNGQRIFEQNCSRCHNPPEGFSPRISGAIAHHMRVRAGLSQQDEQAILRFLNPQ